MLAAHKDPKVEGSRSHQSSVTPLFRGAKAPKTFLLLCFGAVREGRMIHDSVTRKRVYN